MKIQTSYNELSGGEKIGKLFLVPTPIGNLNDITFRALDILKSVDYIAAEDTRHTKSLCRHFHIETSLLSYHKHNERKVKEQIRELLLHGKNIALVSDAGTPAISDPGEELVLEAIKNEIPVISLPGPCAAITALVASGLKTQPFIFCGFLPREAKKQKIYLKSLLSILGTLIIYESPHRIKKTLENIHALLGTCNIVIGRELSKKFESYLRGSLSDILNEWQNTDFLLKGELVLMVETIQTAKLKDSPENLPDFKQLNISEHVQYYINEQKMDTNEAIKEVSKVRKLVRQDVYKLFHRK